MVNTQYRCYEQETHLRMKDTHWLKVKGQRKIFHATRKEKKAGVPVLIFDKIDLKTNSKIRDKRHYIFDRNNYGWGFKHLIDFNG